jgi:hypothetical protein
MRGFAEWALFGLRDRFPVANLDGLEWPSMPGLIGFKNYFEIQVLGFFLAGSVNGADGST